MKQAKLENKLLTESALAALFFAVLGVVLGVFTGSQMILFDGVYSFISVILSVVSLWAAKFMQKRDEKKYPFGKSAVEPLVIILKYAILLTVVVYSMGIAIQSILQGGTIINIDIAFLYALVGAVACLLFYARIVMKAKKYQSGLLTAEASQWLIDGLVTVGVLMAFLAMIIFTRLNLFTSFVPYLDPVMVLLVSAFFLKTPVSEIHKALKDIVQVTPNKKTMHHIERIVLEVKNQYQFEETFIRVSKDSKVLWVEIDFIASDETNIETLEDQDQIRELINKNIKSKHLEKWLTISFTKNRKWAV